MGKHIAEYFLFPLAGEVAGEGEHGGSGVVVAVEVEVE